MRVTIGASAGHLLPGMHPWRLATEVEAATRRALGCARRGARFPAMMALLDQASREIAGDGEAQEFLAWLREDNFVLLGHRHLVLEGDGALGAGSRIWACWRARRAPGLRCPRGPAQPGRERPAWPSPTAVAWPTLMRNTIASTQHADVIRHAHPRCRGPRDGRAALPRRSSPRSTITATPPPHPAAARQGGPHLTRRSVCFTAMTSAHRNILDTWPRDERFQASEAEILEGARIARQVSPSGRAPRCSSGPILRPLRLGDRLVAARGLRHAAAFPRGRDAGPRPWRAALRLLHRARRCAAGAGALHHRHRSGAACPARPCGAGKPPWPETAAHLATGWPMCWWRSVAKPRRVPRSTSGAMLSHLATARPRHQARPWPTLALAEEALASGRAEAAVLQPPGCPQRIILRLAVPGHALAALADALPLFESLDLRAIEEVPHQLVPQGCRCTSSRSMLACPSQPERAPALLEALES